MPLVQLTDLCKIYSAGESEVRALGGVSLSIEAGEFVAITGQSGSGKSTLMNMLGCLDAPDAGSYLLDGKNVADIPETILAGIRNRRIGFIFQSFNLIPSLTALENVELPLIYRRIPRRERLRLAQEALERVGIANRMRHYPAQLSGGQQQRAAIARAIAAKPPIILADEPTGNLDADTAEEITAILKESAHGFGKCVVVVTHSAVVANQADVVLEIKRGHLQERTLSALS